MDITKDRSPNYEHLGFTGTPEELIPIAIGRIATGGAKRNPENKTKGQYSKYPQISLQ